MTGWQNKAVAIFQLLLNFETLHFAATDSIQARVTRFFGEKISSNEIAQHVAQRQIWSSL
jgi:hypothetical protein